MKNLSWVDPSLLQCQLIIARKVLVSLLRMPLTVEYYHRIMQSLVMQFPIGKDQKPFLIHGALIDSFPPKILRPPIIGSVDESVFACCCEFVYSGDYSVPSPISRPYESDCGQPNGSTLSDGSLRQCNPVNFTRNIFHPRRLSRFLAGIAELLDKAPENEHSADQSTATVDDYTEIFLCHAKVYHLAWITDWAALCHLSFYRLTRLLVRFNLCDKRTGDIVPLLRFVFVESEQMEDMERLLEYYVSWNVETMMQDMNFRCLLNRVPSIEKSIFRSMWQ